jgi:hypothetical protein
MTAHFPDREARRFADDPAAYFGGSADLAYRIPRDELSTLQIAAARNRFLELRDRLPVLKSVADKQRVSSIESIDSLGSLLFPHTVYKSYPVALLETNRFDLLTKWLSRLTTHDLSAAEVSKCDSIDSWLDVMDADTELLLAHSSGTSGVMSFLPRSKAEYAMNLKTMELEVRRIVGIEPSEDIKTQNFHVILLGFRDGRSIHGRASKYFFRDRMARSENHFHPLYDFPMSSDVMFFAARLRSAAGRGELSRIEISPRMKARRAEFEKIQRDTARALDRLFEEVILPLRGQRVWIAGLANQIHDLAKAGLERGLKKVFAPGTTIQTSGGAAKGLPLAPNWVAEALEFTGASSIAKLYGMTEVSMTSYQCSESRHHIPPWVIPFVLNADTGDQLPRAGVQVGRAAFFDLVPGSYWGGFISGDEVSIDWSPCNCGATTPHLDSTIRRFSEKQGGDDKINCAASAEAHHSAIDFLSGVSA